MFQIAKENAETGHLKSLDIYDSNIFGINPIWKYIGIYEYDNLNTYDNVDVYIDENSSTNSINAYDYKTRASFYNNIYYPNEIIEIVERRKKLYDSLISKYHRMVNDSKDYIYEENRMKRGKNPYGTVKDDQINLERVKQYLKTGKYKYCLYKGSFNHTYDEVQEWNGQDPDKLFNGQICWLTNKENVKNNIICWMESPLFDLWRRYYLSIGGVANCCRYGLVPALDFGKPEKEFKSLVKKLNNFDKEEIQSMIKFGIHNADKL